MSADLDLVQYAIAIAPYVVVVVLIALGGRDIDAVISVSAFAHPEWMMQRFLKSVRVPELLSRVIIRYVEWLIGHRYEAIAPVNTVCNIRCPILIVHGRDDRTVPVEDALAIEQGCP